MSLIYLDGFDHFVIADITKKWTSLYPAIQPNQIGVGTGRCGSNCVILFGESVLHKGLTVGGTPTVGTAGLAFNPRTSVPVNIAGPGFGAATVGHWYAWMSVDGKLNISDGNGNLRVSSAADVLRLNNWHYLEFQWLISATVGTIIVRVNNAVVINASGLDLAHSGAASTAWTEWLLYSSLQGENWFDDLYVLDDVDDGLTPSLATFLGDTRVEYLRPTANGAHQDWTVTGGGTHANAVDKGSNSALTTPFIESQTVGQLDTNVYSDPTIGVGLAFGVQINVLAQKDTSGFRTIAPVVRSGGGTDAVGSAVSPPQGQSTYGIQAYGRNPNTLAAWSIPEIAADEFGVKLLS